jgi:hypothetical protein
MSRPGDEGRARLNDAAPAAAAKVLVISRAIMRRTHEYFTPYREAGVETACFWFGVDAGDAQVATTVAAPKLFQTFGNYMVEMGSMRRLSAAMRAHGLTNLAQVHTHPSDWVDHSTWDDERAYSTREGAVSIVWPDYGLGLAHDLRGLGVHERRGGEWVRLDARDAAARVRLVDDFADHRWQIEHGRIRDEE